MAIPEVQARVIQPSRKDYTLEDYLALTNEYPRYELLEGELIEMVSPTSRHQRILQRLFRSLDYYCVVNRAGEVFVAPLDVILAPNVVVQPDLLFISEARRAQLIHERIHGAPDLIVEILSPTSSGRDLHQKRRLYARHGVAEYWIVDPDDGTIEVQRLTGNLYSTVALFEPGQSLVSTLFPGLAIELALVFGK
ncbi:MAG: Uma2 family endonuclease [Anaerolineales bacterium]